MLIVCTKDPTIVATARNPASGSGQWGRLVVIDPGHNQAQATSEIEQALQGLNEPLCFSAHGNDNEIGDAGNVMNDWGWNRTQIATMLAQRVARNFAGPILIHACADKVSNFSAGLAVALESLKALRGVWAYGYNRPVPSRTPFPSPNTLDKNVELQGTQVGQVHASEERLPGAQSVTPSASPSPPAPRVVTLGNGYRASFPSGHVIDVPQGFDTEEVRRLLGLLAESPLR